jgi:valyl-tRNA synthetase
VVCEEIYSHIFEEEFNLLKSIHVRGNCAKASNSRNRDDVRNIGKTVLQIVADVRKYKSEKNVSLKEKLEKLKVCAPYNLSSVVDDIENVCNVKNLTIVVGESYSVDFN